MTTPGMRAMRLAVLRSTWSMACTSPVTSALVRAAGSLMESSSHSSAWPRSGFQ